jgi:plastocyanin
MLSKRFAVIVFTLISATACGGYSSPPSSAPSPTPAPAPGGASSSVAIPTGASLLTKTAFSPDDLTVAVGTTVTWMNTDSVSHTSTSDGSGWNSGAIAPGAQFSFAFQTTGTFAYHCGIHPGMVGSVIVR